MTVRELALRAGTERRQATGEADWIDEVIRSHERRVLMTAYRLLGRMEDARDAAQEVFFRLHKYRRRLDRVRDPAPWLYRMTVNVCIDAGRRRRELPLEPTLDVASGEPGPEAAIDRETERQRLHRALRRLPEKQRAAIVLRDIEGLSTREVAEILECSEVTVRTHISAGRLRLREWIGRMR